MINAKLNARRTFKRRDEGLSANSDSILGYYGQKSNGRQKRQPYLKLFICRTGM
jgi:hypothetical protein